MTHSDHTLKQLGILLTLGLLSVTSGACLPSTIDPTLLNGIPSTEELTDTDTPDDETDSETESVAQDQCTLYDKSSPLRDFCVSCYDDLVSTYCPGKTSISDCVDAEFILDFPTRLNQCIDATVVAGFTCTKTCSSTQVLDEVSCSCVSASTTSGTTALEEMDRGQFDIGPPVVTASFGQTIERIVFDGDTGETAAAGLISDCALGSSDSDTNPLLFLAIRNRTGTRVQDNVMTATKSSTSVTGISFSVSAPEVLATSGAIGANGGAAVNLSDQGTDMFEDANDGSYSGVAGGLRRLSGLPEPGPSPTPTAAPTNDTLMGEQVWTQPYAAARDKYGNLYFIDKGEPDKDGDEIFGDDTVWVTCYDTIGSTSEWCDGKETGKSYLIAGGGDGSDDYRAGEIDNKDAFFSSLNGIAVDAEGAVVVADRGNNDAIALICPPSAPTEGLCSKAPAFAGGGSYTADNVRAIAGAIRGGAFNTNTLSRGDTDLDNDGDDDSTASGIDSPIAVEIETFDDGDTRNGFNLYIANLSNGGSAGVNLTAVCHDATVDGPCKTLGTGIHVMTSANRITDVKLAPGGNLFWVEPNRGRIRAACMDPARGDACQGKATYSTSGTHVTLNDSSKTTESGDGGALSSAGFVLPFRLVIAKRYADDLDTGVTDAYDFADKNLIVISALSTFNNDTADRKAGGNTVRIVCGTTVDGLDAGDSDDFAGSKGFCEDLEEGKVYTLAGQAGRSGVGASSTSSPRGVSFGNLTGGTYDRFKNLILTSAHDTTTFENDDDLTNQDGDSQTDDVDFDIDDDKLDNAVRRDSGNPFADGDTDGSENCRDDDLDNDGEIDNDIDDDNNNFVDCDEAGRFDEDSAGLSGEDPAFPPVYDNSIYSLQLVHKSDNLRVRYNFTDSNNFTSRYCFEMRMQSTCGFSLEDASDTEQKVFCACNVVGPAGGIAITDFWRGIPRDEDCP